MITDFALEAFKQDCERAGMIVFGSGFTWWIRSLFCSYYRALNGTSLVCKNPFGLDFNVLICNAVNSFNPGTVHCENSPTVGWCSVRDTSWAPPT